MAKIYKQPVANELYKDYVTPLSIIGEMSQADINPLTLYVNVQPDFFEIKLTYVEEILTFNSEGAPIASTFTPSIVFWNKVKLSELTSKNSFCDNSLWTVKLSDMFARKTVSNTGEISVRELVSTQIRDQFSNTFINKGNSVNKDDTSDYLYQIFVPFTDGANMTDFTYKVFVDTTFYGIDAKNIPLVIDPSSPSKDIIQDGTIRPIELITPITVTGPDTIAADSSVTVNFETTPGVSFVYLEQVHGILPRVKVPVVNGTGSFKVLTTGMSTGDEIQVKVGFRKWNNVVQYTKTIS
jgi:hypothetical protein